MEEPLNLQPNENMNRFRLHLSKANGFRLGALSIRGHTLRTPHFVVPTSRGAVPHLTPDVLAKHTSITAVHVGLEDFVERTTQKAPVLSYATPDSKSRLRDFTALPENVVEILGPRRVPPVACPGHNTNSAIVICTSTGFQPLTVKDYNNAASDLDADITIGIADTVTTTSASQKRMEKSADRTHAWLRDLFEKDVKGQMPVYAGLLPLEAHQQSFYLADLSNEYRYRLAGLTLYAAETAATIPEPLHGLARICLTEVQTPHDILRLVDLGNDLVTLSMVTTASEKGLAFDFSFSQPRCEANAPLATDLWQPDHITDTSALVVGCRCYACQKHHRAYINHLLNAKEMLAWTLLQIHNFHVVAQFFSDIRTSIEDGTFEDKAKAFRHRYALDLPEALGEGPRTRGYQTKSMGGGESKKNKKAYGRLDDQLMKLQEAESGIATPAETATASDFEMQGLGQSQ